MASPLLRVSDVDLTEMEMCARSFRDLVRGCSALTVGLVLKSERCDQIVEAWSACAMSNCSVSSSAEWNLCDSSLVVSHPSRTTALDSSARDLVRLYRTALDTDSNSLVVGQRFGCTWQPGIPTSRALSIRRGVADRFERCPFLGNLSHGSGVEWRLEDQPLVSCELSVN